MQLGPIRHSSAIAWRQPTTISAQPNYQAQSSYLPIDRMEVSFAPLPTKPRGLAGTRAKLLSAAALTLSFSTLAAQFPSQVANWSVAVTASPVLAAPTKVPQQFSQAAVQSYYLCPEEESLSAQGRALYESLKIRYLGDAQAIDMGTPTAYFTGGLPGSGKGQLLEKMHAMGGFVVVDPDLLKRDVMLDLLEKNPASVQPCNRTQTGARWSIGPVLCLPKS
jgi:hypothetical protein